MPADLLIVNATVITNDPARPVARAVAVRAGVIAAVGDEAAVRRSAPAAAPVVDATGLTVVPGFVDAHLHLAAYAAALRAVDCSPAAVRTIDAIVAAVRARARATPPGQWVRATGYDEWALAEGRHPTRWELDAATTAHPVRLVHRSGHAVVLNSRALALAGITIASEEPPGGVIDRRLSDGEPSGLLLEMNDAIGRLAPPLPRAALVAGLAEAGRRLIAAGVTAVQDMSHTNTAATSAFLDALAWESGFTPRLLPVAEGWPGDVTALSTDHRRPVKVMVREAGARPLPDTDQLAGIIRRCAAAGRQVALHAVERRTVEAVVDAFERTGAAARTEALRHRIEHCGVCPPELARRIAAAGLTVVSNPAFLWFGGDRYRRTVPPDDLPDLYAVGTLARAGVAVAAGSDAPVTPPGPLHGIAAAVHRRDALGEALPGETVDVQQAVLLHSLAPARAAWHDQRIGSIRQGWAADLALLSGAPADRSTTVLVTVIDGVVRHVAPEFASRLYR